MCYGINTITVNLKKSTKQNKTQKGIGDYWHHVAGTGIVFTSSTTTLSGYACYNQFALICVNTGVKSWLATLYSLLLFFHLNTETKYLFQPNPEKEPTRSSEGTDGADGKKTALSQKQRQTCGCRHEQQQVPPCVMQQRQSRRQRSLQVQQKTWAVKSVYKTEVCKQQWKWPEDPEGRDSKRQKDQQKHKKEYLQRERQPVGVRVQFRVPDTGEPTQQEESPEKEECPRSSSTVSCLPLITED